MGNTSFPQNNFLKVNCETLCHVIIWREFPHPCLWEGERNANSSSLLFSHYRTGSKHLATWPSIPFTGTDVTLVYGPITSVGSVGDKPVQSPHEATVHVCTKHPSSTHQHKNRDKGYCTKQFRLRPGVGGGLLWQLRRKETLFSQQLI